MFQICRVKKPHKLSTRVTVTECCTVNFYELLMFDWRRGRRIS